MNSFRAERNNCRRRLILLVKKHPILWNKTQEDYKRNRSQKSQTWQEIAELLGSSADKIRRTWENLRDQYRRDLKREMKYGYSSKWRFFNDMDFIRDMVTCKGAQNEFTDSDSELDTTEISRIIRKALEPNPMSEPMLATYNKTRQNLMATPHVTEFHPIILSKQWQKEDNRQAPSVSATLSGEVSDPKANPSTPAASTMAHMATSRSTLPNLGNLQNPVFPEHGTSHDHSHNQDSQPSNPAAAIIEVQHKVEIDSDIEIEPIRTEPPEAPLHTDTVVRIRTAQEREEFQEAHVSTSSLQRSSLSLAAQSEPQTSAPSKKRKSSKSEIEHKDEDYYFVMSLLPSLRQIPRNKKIPLRIAFMNLIAKDLEEVCK